MYSTKSHTKREKKKKEKRRRCIVLQYPPRPNKIWGVGGGGGYWSAIHK